MKITNELSAVAEARRRAFAMCDAYSIYRRGSDFIVRQSVALPPLGEGWFLFATFQPNGPPDGGCNGVVQTFASNRGKDQ